MNKITLEQLLATGRTRFLCRDYHRAGEVCPITAICLRDDLIRAVCLAKQLRSRFSYIEGFMDGWDQKGSAVNTPLIPYLEGYINGRELRANFVCSGNNILSLREDIRVQLK